MPGCAHGQFMYTSPRADPLRHSPALRAMQYEYASAVPVPIVLPCTGELTSASGCAPQSAIVGCSFLLTVPMPSLKPPELVDPPRFVRLSPSLVVVANR